MSAEQGTVAAVSRNNAYTFTKPNRERIVLVAGLGVEGDVHAGVNVRHRSRVAADPAQPNLRQVHLIQAELFAEVAEKGFEVPPGGLGENVTTSGIDLLSLPRGTILRFGQPGVGPGESAGGSGNPVEGVLEAARAAVLDEATARAAAAVEAAAERDAAGRDTRPAVVVAGLRNPCAQINGFRPGLLKEVVEQDPEGNVVRKAGVMAVVLRGGPVEPGDAVTVELPPGPHGPLERV